MDFLKRLIRDKNKGFRSSYRTIAVLGGGIVLVQSTIWSILCLISMIYYSWGAPHSGKYENLMAPFAYVITVIYFRARPFDSCSNIPAVAVFMMSLVYFLMSVHLIYSSIILLVAAGHWEDPPKVRKSVAHWVFSVIVMSIFEFSVGLSFFTEFLLCSYQEEYSIAAAAITLSTLFIKGFVLWCFNLVISLTLFCMQYCEFDVCPV